MTSDLMWKILQFWKLLGIPPQKKLRKQTNCDGLWLFRTNGTYEFDCEGNKIYKYKKDKIFCGGFLGQK